MSCLRAAPGSQPPAQSRWPFVLSLPPRSRCVQGQQQNRDPKSQPGRTRSTAASCWWPPCPALPAVPLTSRDAFPPVDLGEERRAGGRVVGAGARGGRSRRGRRARGGRRSPCGGSGWRFSPFCRYRTLKEASERKGRCTSSTSAAITTQHPPGSPAGAASTYCFAPGQPRGVILFDVGLQLCPDTQVSFHPVHLLFISRMQGDREEAAGAFIIRTHGL